MVNKMSEELTKYFERVNKMVEYFEKRGLTLTAFYTIPNALCFKFEFGSTNAGYEYTVKVEVDLDGDFFCVADELFDRWLEETYDKLTKMEEWAQNGKGE